MLRVEDVLGRELSRAAVVEGAVNNRVCLLGAALGRGWVVEVAAVRFSTHRLELLGAAIGASEAEHLVPRIAKERDEP